MLNLLPLVCALWACADPPAAPVEVVAALESALGDAIEKAEPSVVAIARTKAADGEGTTAVRGRPAPTQTDPRGLAREFNPDGGDMVSFDYGSGVVIGDRGEILTAFHVVKGASRLNVRAVDRQGVHGAVTCRHP